jgi:hypothetical protein
MLFSRSLSDPMLDLLRFTLQKDKSKESKIRMIAI